MQGTVQWRGGETLSVGSGEMVSVGGGREGRGGREDIPFPASDS